MKTECFYAGQNKKRILASVMTHTLCDNYLDIYRSLQVDGPESLILLQETCNLVIRSSN